MSEAQPVLKKNGMMRVNEDFLSDLPRMVSVDIETSGPNPANYALLSIGACTLPEPRATFYAELKPVSLFTQPEAMDVHHLNLDRLMAEGLSAESALLNLADWLKQAVRDERGPLFVGFNSPFDWMFVNDYFHRFLGFNPFGHSALDIKSFAMGFKRIPWDQTGMSALTDKPLRHNALDDALDQADVLISLLNSEGFLLDGLKRTGGRYE